MKVLSSHSCGHAEVRCPVDKKNISVVKNIALMLWKAVASRASTFHDIPEMESLLVG